MRQIIFLLIIAVFGAFIYFLTKKIQSKLIVSIILLGIGVILGWLIPLSLYTIEVLDKLLINFALAMLFLYSVSFDIKTLFQPNKIGCSCTIGVKKYWLFVALSIVVAFISQIIVYLILKEENIYLAGLCSVVFGIIGAQTPLYRISGAKEIATTMFYLSAILGGMKLFLTISSQYSLQ